MKELPLDFIWEIQVRLHSMEIYPLEDFFLHSKPHLQSSIAPLSGVFSCLLTPTETENGQRSTISLKSSKVQKDKKEKSLDSYQLVDFKVNAPFSVLFSTRSLLAVDTNILQETYSILKIRNSRRKKRINQPSYSNDRWNLRAQPWTIVNQAYKLWKNWKLLTR